MLKLTDPLLTRAESKAISVFRLKAISRASDPRYVRIRFSLAASLC
jgi:hypothetical protein